MPDGAALESDRLLKQSSSGYLRYLTFRKEEQMERRVFMKGVLAVASASPFVGKAMGANDRIRVGQIGLGGRGKY